MKHQSDIREKLHKLAKKTGGSAQSIITSQQNSDHLQTPHIQQQRTVMHQKQHQTHRKQQGSSSQKRKRRRDSDYDKNLVISPTTTVPNISIPSLEAAANPISHHKVGLIVDYLF